MCKLYAHQVISRDYEQALLLAAACYAHRTNHAWRVFRLKVSASALFNAMPTILCNISPHDAHAGTLLDNAKNGFVVETADRIYGEQDNTGRIYDGAPVRDTPANRLRGWQRICLLVCFFGPSRLYEPAESFAAYAGRPFVFPVVRRRPPPALAATAAALSSTARPVRVLVSRPLQHCTTWTRAACQRR